MIGKWLLTGGGLLVLVWAFMSPQFRNSEGFLSAKIIVPAAVGMSLILIRFSLRRPWTKAAFGLTLALTGQASTLQWIDAGPLIHYQHYKPLGRLLTEHSFTLTFFLLQTAFTAAGLHSHIKDIWRWMRKHFKLWQLSAAAVVFLFTSATVSRDISFFLVELLLAGAVQTVHLATVILAVASLPEKTLLTWRKRAEGWLCHDRFVPLAAVWITLASAGLNFWIYDRHPHIPDEVSYLLQARYFAQKQLAMNIPPAPEAFDIDLMTYDKDRWYSPFPPGWPAFLALGELLGAAWLVNPVLAGLNVILTYLFFLETGTRRQARWIVLLLGFSPWHIFMAMNFMSHTFTMTCALIAALGIARSRRTGSVLWCCIAGLATGIVSLIRPLDALIVGVLLGLWAIGLSDRRLRFPALAAFGCSAVITGALTFPYNKFLTGNSGRAPVMDYFDRYYAPGVNDLGFGPNRGVGWPIDPYPGHTPFEALINANLNTFSINVELLGWSTGSLALIALLVFSGAMQKTARQMLAAIGAVVAVLSVYWFSGGPDFGARYWYLVLVPCLALTVRGMEYLQERLGGNGVRVSAAVLLLCGIALATYFPWRALDKYHHYLLMRPDIRELARKHRFGRSLVLIRGARHPDYASAAIYNPLDLRNGKTLYGWDRSPAARAQALQAYSDRPVWLIDGPSITRGGFRVAAGPLPPGALQER